MRRIARSTKIVATLGPATSGPERVAALIAAGVDVVRLNFSHGSYEDHREHIVSRSRSQPADLHHVAEKAMIAIPVDFEVVVGSRNGVHSRTSNADRLADSRAV